MKNLKMCTIFMHKSKRKNAEISEIIKVLNAYNTDNDILYQLMSYQHIKENEKGCFNHNIISWYNIKPYTCKEISFLFYKDDYKIVLTADNKKKCILSF